MSLLKNALADDFSFDKTFNLERQFDAIFFSFSISMIPTWKESIANALANLKNGRSLYIVDFYDQSDLPIWFRKILAGWLVKFGVCYWRDLIPFLKNLQRQHQGVLSINSLYRSYSFIAEFKKSYDSDTYRKLS